MVDRWRSAQDAMDVAMAAFMWLNANGCRDKARELHDEIGLALLLEEHLQGKKSSYQAKKDGDWEHLLGGLQRCSSANEVMIWKVANKDRIMRLPWTFREGLEEETQRYLDTLREIEVEQ